MSMMLLTFTFMGEANLCYCTIAFGALVFAIYSTRVHNTNLPFYSTPCFIFLNILLYGART